MVNQPDDDGSPSPYPRFTTIERNLMIANYNSQEAVVSTRDTGHSARVIPRALTTVSREH